MADVSKNDLGRKNETEKKDGIFKKAGRWVKDHWKGLAVGAGVAVGSAVGGYFLGKGHDEGQNGDAIPDSEPVVSEPTYSDLPDA